MADTHDTTPPPPPPPPGRGAAGPGGPGPELPEVGGGGRRPPRFTRRQVLTMAGAGGLVGAGLVANRWISEEPVSDRDPAGGVEHELRHELLIERARRAGDAVADG